MSSAGLHPTEELELSVTVSKARLAEFDRLYAEGGIEAVIAAMQKASKPPRSKQPYVNVREFVEFL